MRQQAFTLIELLMAMAIMSIIGAAIAGVSVTMSNGYSDSSSYYDSLQSGRSTVMKLQSLIRKSKLVTAGSSDSLVLWVQDTNQDGQINRDELQMVIYDNIRKEIRLITVEIPEGPDKNLLNVERTLATITDIGAAAVTINSDLYRKSYVLACDVQNCKFVFSPAPPQSKLVSIEFQIGDGKAAFTLSSSIHLRASCASEISFDNNQWDQGS